MQRMTEIAERTGGRYHITDLIDAVQAMNMQAWGVLSEGAAKGLVLTEIIKYPRKKSLRIFGLAGEDFDAWHEMAVAELTTFATQHECAMIEAGGRPGWSRKLDWKVTHHYVERDI
tara:strand:- start:2364 stop:2711 length:348 start_codon:yes stop_codon:yes gene_type:complete